MQKKHPNNEMLASQFLDESRKLSKGRFTRFMIAPLRLIAIKLYIKLGVIKAKSLPLNFGGLTFFGMIPEAVSSVIWRFGFFDPKTSYIVSKSLPKGGVFIDVGAHFGYFSLLGSECVGDSGRVVSIEAMPSTFNHLKENIENNSLSGICEVFNLAAYNKEVQLNFNDFGVINSSLNSAFGDRSGKTKLERINTVNIEAKPLDIIVKQLQLSRIDLIKIDAESSEYFVISGLIETLQQFKPNVIVELGDIGVSGAEHSTRDIIDLMMSLGYVCKTFDPSGQTKAIKLKTEYEYCNVLFEYEKSLK